MLRARAPASNILTCLPVFAGLYQCATQILLSGKCPPFITNPTLGPQVFCHSVPRASVPTKGFITAQFRRQSRTIDGELNCVARNCRSDSLRCAVHRPRALDYAEIKDAHRKCGKAVESRRYHARRSPETTRATMPPMKDRRRCPNTQKSRQPVATGGGFLRSTHTRAGRFMDQRRIRMRCRG